MFHVIKPSAITSFKNIHKTAVSPNGGIASIPYANFVSDSSKAEFIKNQSQASLSFGIAWG